MAKKAAKCSKSTKCCKKTCSKVSTPKIDVKNKQLVTETAEKIVDEIAMTEIVNKFELFDSIKIPDVTIETEKSVPYTFKTTPAYTLAQISHFITPETFVSGGPADAKGKEDPKIKEYVANMQKVMFASVIMDNEFANKAIKLTEELLKHRTHQQIVEGVEIVMTPIDKAYYARKRREDLKEERQRQKKKKTKKA